MFGGQLQVANSKIPCITLINEQSSVIDSLSITWANSVVLNSNLVSRLGRIKQNISHGSLHVEMNKSFLLFYSTINLRAKLEF